MAVRRILKRRVLNVRLTVKAHEQLERWARESELTIAELARRIFDQESARRIEAAAKSAPQASDHQAA